MMLKTLIDVLTAIRADNGDLDVAIGLPEGLLPSRVFEHAELGNLGNYYIGSIVPLEVHPNTEYPEFVLITAAKE